MEKYTREEIKKMLEHKRITLFDVFEAYFELTGMSSNQDFDGFMEGMEDYIDNKKTK